MSHHHTDHHHDDNEAKELTFAEKAVKILAHWQQHNDDHAHTYRRWADDFHHHQFPEVAILLESAAELTRQINQILHQASQLVSDKAKS